MRKTPILMLLPLTLPACALFAPAPLTVTANVVGCTGLIPTDWEEGVGKQAPDPPADDQYGTMAKYADALAGLLGVADDREKATIHITRGCEERDREAQKKATRRRIFGERESWYKGHGIKGV